MIRQYETMDELIENSDQLYRNKVAYVKSEDVFFVYEDGVVRRQTELDDKIVEEWLRRFRECQE